MIFSYSLYRTFYEAHTAFFLGGVFFFFGFIGGNEHLAIAHFIASDPSICGWLLIPWIMYTLHCTRYLSNTLMLPSSLILRNQALLPTVQQLFGIAYTIFMVLLPVLGYTWFVLFFAVQVNLFVSTLLIGYSILSISIPTWWLRSTLRKPIREESYRLLSLRLGTKKPTHPFFWYFQGLLSEPVLLFFTKTASLVFTVAVCQLYFTDAYDWRLIALGMLLISGTQITIVKHYLQFSYIRNRFFLNLPRSLRKLFISTHLTFLLIIVPEWLILIRYLSGTLSFWSLLELLIFGWVVLSFFAIFGVRYLRNFEPYYTRIFFISIGLFLVIMYSVPLVLTIPCLGTFGWFIQKKTYIQIPELP